MWQNAPQFQAEKRYLAEMRTLSACD